jgi:hypothetical protein
LADEALGHAELVVRGEGETAMNALLDLWSEGYVPATDAQYAAVPNLSWKDAAGVVRHNDLASWIADLDALPASDFSLAGGTADYRWRQKIVVVQTSAAACLIARLFGNGHVREETPHRSVEATLWNLH